MFRSFNANTVPFELPPHPDPRPLDDARELIGRYPNLSEIELARLIKCIANYRRSIWRCCCRTNN